MGSQSWGILKHFPQSRCILISYWSREKGQSSIMIKIEGDNWFGWNHLFSSLFPDNCWCPYLESPRNANPNNDPHCHPNHRHHLPHLRWIRYWLKRLLQEKVAFHLFHKNGSVVNFVKYFKYVKGTSADIDILVGLRRTENYAASQDLSLTFLSDWKFPVFDEELAGRLSPDDLRKGVESD